MLSSLFVLLFSPLLKALGSAVVDAVATNHWGVAKVADVDPRVFCGAKAAEAMICYRNLVGVG